MTMALTAGPVPRRRRRSARNAAFRTVAAAAIVVQLGEAVTDESFTEKSTTGTHALTQKTTEELVREFIVDGRRFELSRHLALRVIEEESESGPIWSHVCREFDSISYGLSEDESREMFELDFACSWDSIACEDDSRLTLDAQSLKKTLLSLVKVSNVQSGQDDQNEGSQDFAA